MELSLGEFLHTELYIREEYTMKKIKGTLFLLLAALIWGMAFVAQSSAADTIGAFTFNATRSLLAAVFLITIIAIKENIRKSSEVAQAKNSSGSCIFGGAMCGIMLFLGVNFQQFGIAAYPENVAASGRAGFLTATYVIMVALVAWFTTKKMHPAVLVATVSCIAGMYMLCLSEGLTGIYVGDVLVLTCAICFTGHILTVNHFSKLDGIKLSCIQFLVCGVLSTVGMFIFEKPELSAIRNAWLPIFYAGIFSSGIGYTLQILGQKYSEPSVASIVMSLESVFAALAGWVLLKERLSSNELLGCVLVFLSVILAQIPDMVKKNKKL